MQKVSIPVSVSGIVASQNTNVANSNTLQMTRVISAAKRTQIIARAAGDCTFTCYN